MFKKDYQDISDQCFDKVWRNFEQGKPYFEWLKKMHEAQLLGYKQNSDIIKKVEIITESQFVCPSCKKLNGKKLTIDQALKEMPLPNKECEYIKNQNSVRPCCPSEYLPVV